MNPTREHQRQVQQAYDQFLKEVAALRSDYGDNSVTSYLTSFRPRISAQIVRQLALVHEDGTAAGRMLSLGGWPGIAPIILRRLTGIDVTLVDHPALLSDRIRTFYDQHALKALAFDFADGSREPLPISGTFDLIECCQCLEHWNFSPLPIVRQLFTRLLSRKGSLFVTVPNAVGLYRRLSVLIGQSPYPRMTAFIDTAENKPGAEVSPHWREYTRKDLQSMVAYCGGVCTELRTASYPITSQTSWLHGLYLAVSRLHPQLRANVEAVCKVAPAATP